MLEGPPLEQQPESQKISVAKLAPGDVVLVYGKGALEYTHTDRRSSGQVDVYFTDGSKITVDDYTDEVEIPPHKNGTSN